MAQEITVASHEPMPKGYCFLHKGNRFKTRHGRQLTHASGEVLYVVVDSKKKVGLRVPAFVYKQVQTRNTKTLAARTAAVEHIDAAYQAKVAAQIALQFPGMPKEDRKLVLKHAFRKYSGRVGRTKALTLEKKVLLAVIAHIRHRHTSYHAHLKEGESRDMARKMTSKAIDEMVCHWATEKSAEKAWCGCLRHLTDKLADPSRASQYSKAKAAKVEAAAMSLRAI